MTDLTIAWQRLVDAGQTCPRCGDTGSEVRTAAATLTAALAPLGITVRLAEATINLAQFEQAPLESNRILIAGVLRQGSCRISGFESDHTVGVWLTRE